MRLKKKVQEIGVSCLFILFAVMPILAPAIGEAFYVDVFARSMIWSIAAVGLNLV